ncbi:Interactor of constitutive active ROPs 2, chloroplastic [Vitis vinifera]|uniref:Interactor of constitutive active ROPs 2, chloroplastic n=1 Tax=Vitis vinifera TaxID=29760 RepID=A0A438IQ68_VITVI|nr:Interactor of constitutive active ROPs 2, chloroplastic [Vitis vinifera]
MVFAAVFKQCRLVPRSGKDCSELLQVVWARVLKERIREQLAHPFPIFSTREDRICRHQKEVNFHTNCLHSFTVTEYVIGLHAPFSSDTGCYSTDSESRTGSLEVPPRTSPATPRTARKLKTPGSDGDSVSSPHPASRTPKDRSPKIVKSTRSPVSEKKRPSKLSELESQVAQLQEDLKKTKDQLNSSESWKRRAHQEAEEAKKQLLAVSAKLEESQQQLLELSASEEDRVQELRKISQDRDRAWQSELEAVQKQHSMDSAALVSAMNEIQKLKIQLEMVADSEASQTKHAESAHVEIQRLRIELADTLSLVAAETIRSDGVKAMEAYNSITLELDQSNAQVNSLEGLVSKLQEDLVNSSSTSAANPSDDAKLARENGENEDTNQLKQELNLVRFEVGQLRSALDAAEIRYQEEYIQSTLQIRSAYEQAERTRSESRQREAELEAELRKAKVIVEDLKVNLMDKETKLQNISEENKVLNVKIEQNQSNERESELQMELKKSEATLADLKTSLLDKETELQSITEENEMLKLEIKKKETENDKEADKNSRRAERVTEQLDATQAANSELEAELRRLKVQSDQWRKAAEAAAAMLSTGNNGKIVERTGSLDNNYHTIGARIGSPCSEDMDDDSPKKKNGNMLKKIGVLWKKGQKHFGGWLLVESSFADYLLTAGSTLGKWGDPFPTHETSWWRQQVKMASHAGGEGAGERGGLAGKGGEFCEFSGELLEQE